MIQSVKDWFYQLIKLMDEWTNNCDESLLIAYKILNIMDDIETIRLEFRITDVYKCNYN